MSFTVSPVAPRVAIDYDDEAHRYVVNGQQVPSVTQVLDATLPKPGLLWWAWRAGLAAVIELLRRGSISYGDLLAGHDDHARIVAGEPTEPFAHASTAKSGKGRKKTLVERLAILGGLHYDQIKREAGVRGTGIHDALALLAAGGMPIIDELPEDHRPFADALLRWFLEQRPRFADDGMERLVAYVDQDEVPLYAGRLDLLTWEEDADGQDVLVLNDLKTGKELRADSWFRQLMAYKLAWERMGLPQIARMRVVLCKPDGTYAVYDATDKVVPRSWWACVGQYDAMQEFARLNRKRKARA